MEQGEELEWVVEADPETGLAKSIDRMLLTMDEVKAL
jgi:hypothetical protein